MSFSPSHSAAPERDINADRQPYSIREIMAGPHLRELLTEDPVRAVMVEPLRFIPRMRLGDRDVFPDRSCRA